MVTNVFVFDCDINFGFRIGTENCPRSLEPLLVSFLVASSLNSVDRNHGSSRDYCRCFVYPLLGQSHDFHVVSNMVSNKLVLG